MVEDDYYLATDACEWLSRAGADVIGPFSSAEEACRSVADRTIDAAVLDINLGDGASYQVAGDLEQRRIPFLFATGSDEVVIPERFRDCPRVEKPFSSDQLIDAVRQLG